MNELLTQKEVSVLVSEALRVSARQVYDRYVHMPDFPKPTHLPMSTRKRYSKPEIEAWVMKYAKG